VLIASRIFQVFFNLQSQPSLDEPCPTSDMDVKSINSLEPSIVDSSTASQQLDTESNGTQCSGKLLTYREIPLWYQDGNQFIHSGYRPPSNSAAASFHSWSYLHNESVNIYSHLIPSLIAAISWFYFVQGYFEYHYPLASQTDVLVLWFFLFTAVVCLGTSALYHTLLNHSCGCANLWLSLDYCGIVILTLGCFVSGIYVGFECEPHLRKLYWTMVGRPTSYSEIFDGVERN
jgi:adiponectin receptor